MFGTCWVDSKYLLSHGVLEKLNTGQYSGDLTILEAGRHCLNSLVGYEGLEEQAGYGLLSMRMLSQEHTFHSRLRRVMEDTSCSQALFLAWCAASRVPGGCRSHIHCWDPGASSLGNASFVSPGAPGYHAEGVCGCVGS